MCTRSYKNKALKGLMCLAFTMGTCNLMYGQIIEIGFKGGLNATTFRFDEPSFRKVASSRPLIGYSVGPAVSFKVKNRYFLHTEYLFTQKGRVVRGKLDPMLKDKLVNSFIEIPITYNVFFNGHFRLHGDKRFKYYAGLGPLFSYWLAGRGQIYSGEHNEANLPKEKYKIVFGQRSEEFTYRDEVYVNKPTRLQLGLVLGGGVLTEPDAKHRIMIDFRAEYGHSWQAAPGYEDFVIPNPNTVQISTKARSMGLRLSAMYMIEMNTNKKVRNKGKSNITIQKYKR